MAVKKIRCHEKIKIKNKLICYWRNLNFMDATWRNTSRLGAYAICKK